MTWDMSSWYITALTNAAGFPDSGAVVSSSILPGVEVVPLLTRGVARLNKFLSAVINVNVQTEVNERMKLWGENGDGMFIIFFPPSGTSLLVSLEWKDRSITAERTPRWFMEILQAAESARKIRENQGEDSEHWLCLNHTHLIHSKSLSDLVTGLQHDCNHPDLPSANNRICFTLTD